MQSVANEGSWLIMRARSHRAKAKSIGPVLELDDVVVNRILLKSKQLCIIHICMQIGKSHVYRTVTYRDYWKRISVPIDCSLFTGCPVELYRWSAKPSMTFLTWPSCTANIFCAVVQMSICFRHVGVCLFPTPRLITVNITILGVLSCCPFRLFLPSVLKFVYRMDACFSFCSCKFNRVSTSAVFAKTVRLSLASCSCYYSQNCLSCSGRMV